MHVTRGYKKLGTEIAFTLHSLLLSHSLLNQMHCTEESTDDIVGTCAAIRRHCSGLGPPI